MILWHVTWGHVWRRARRRGVYVSKGWRRHGRLRCSTWPAILAHARRTYPGRRGLVLLALDAAGLAVGQDEHGFFLPAPLPVAAVVAVVPLAIRE